MLTEKQIRSKLDSTGLPVGFASHLNRYNATIASHKNYSRREFILALSDCHQDLGIEWRSETRKRKPDDDEEIVEDEVKLEWQTLDCIRCNRKVKNTRALVEHMVESHGKTQDKLWFTEFSTLNCDLKKLFDKSIIRQTETSVVKKQFNNSNNYLVCPADSPLAPFLMMRHLQVFKDEMPLSTTEGIALKLLIADRRYPICFSFQKVERSRRRIKRRLIKKSLEKRLKSLEKHCARAWITENDVVFKPTRTADENRSLGQALSLPATCSHNDIVSKVNDMKTKHEEINPFCSSVYSKSVKPDGQKMSAEERRLISSLTNELVTPISGKRKTTYKNPSELAPVKKRQKTSSPE